MKVDEYGKHVHILGYKLSRTIDPKPLITAARDACRPVIVQFFDAENVAGEKHLFFATLNAMKSFSQGRNIAQTLDIEILLYASAQRQIGEAIQIVGLTPQTSAIATVLVGDDEEEITSATRRLEPLIPGYRDQPVLDRIDEVKSAALTRVYDIDETEIETLSVTGDGNALVWLVVERVALLDAKR